MTRPTCPGEVRVLWDGRLSPRGDLSSAMMDDELRRRAKRFYRPLVLVLVRLGVSANALTGAGLVVGVLCLVAVALGANVVGLGLWLLNRLLDGLDGELARTRQESSDLGTFVDLVADFFVYGGLLVALAVQHPEARLALVVLMFAYYLNGSAFLVLSQLLHRSDAERLTERGLHFRRSLAEGFETIVAGVLLLLLPGHVELVAWVFAGMVLVSAAQRVADARRVLGRS